MFWAVWNISRSITNVSVKVLDRSSFSCAGRMKIFVWKKYCGKQQIVEKQRQKHMAP